MLATLSRPRRKPSPEAILVRTGVYRGDASRTAHYWIIGRPVPPVRLCDGQAAPRGASPVHIWTGTIRVCPDCVDICVADLTSGEGRLDVTQCGRCA